MAKEKKIKTLSGLAVDQLYTKSDLPDESAHSPGEFPYLRGIHETMYRGRLWTMRQYAGFGTAKETNQRYRYLLEKGGTGLSAAFDLPTQMGRDPDHALVHGEVGRVGVSISCIEDMEELLDSIPLEKISLSMTINSTAPILLALVLVVAERRGVSWKELRGTIQNDILKEYIARGTYIYPPRPALRLVTDIFEFCSKEVPKWNTISVSGYHIREAGSTAVQEMAFTIGNAIAYVEAALSRGLSIDSFAPRMAFFFNCHLNFLEEVAKFRALRVLWAEIIKNRFKASDANSMKLRFHTQTAGSSLTAQQPYNNVVRTTLQALAAVFGGTQSLHTNAFDEALGLPTRESAELALRTQQIIAHESGVADSVDPLGGSYLIENWTDRLKTKTEELLSVIEGHGGMVGAIEAGFPQEEIAGAAYQYQQDVESEERLVVGVNAFENKEKIPAEIHQSDPEGEKRQVQRIQALRKRRDEKKAEQQLSALGKAAEEPDTNLMPLILDAVRADCTLGEISDVLRGVFGEYRE